MKRDKQIGVSLTKDEFKTLRLEAFKNEKSMSQFVRDIVLKKIKNKEVKNG